MWKANYDNSCSTKPCCTPWDLCCPPKWVGTPGCESLLNLAASNHFLWIIIKHKFRWNDSKVSQFVGLNAALAQKAWVKGKLNFRKQTNIKKTSWCGCKLLAKKKEIKGINGLGLMRRWEVAKPNETGNQVWVGVASLKNKSWTWGNTEKINSTLQATYYHKITTNHWL